MSNISESRFAKNQKVELVSASSLGTRKYQQDFALIIEDQNHAAGVICDGMGGRSGGEKASRLAASIFYSAYMGRENQKDIPHFLRSTAVEMDKQVAGLLDEDRKPLKAGTTAIISMIQNNTLYWLSIGDSRIYFIRGGQMKAVTNEHNYRLRLQEKLRAGMISIEQYNNEEKMPKADALISFIGMNGLKRVDGNITPFRLMAGDMILMCSDGLYNSLNDSQILAMIQDNEFDLEIAADRLVEMSVSFGSGKHDNTSVILIRCLGEQEEM